MSINIMSQNGMTNYNVKEIVCDTIDDLPSSNFQTSYAPGSTAFIIATSEVYMLNGQREWVLI